SGIGLGSVLTSRWYRPACAGSPAPWVAAAAQAGASPRLASASHRIGHKCFALVLINDAFPEEAPRLVRRSGSSAGCWRLLRPSNTQHLSSYLPFLAPDVIFTSGLWSIGQM